jgi:hypothetical protein
MRKQDIGFARQQMSSENPLRVGTKIRIESLKEENSQGANVSAHISGGHLTREVFTTSRPQTKPSASIWMVCEGSSPNSLRFKNEETGHWLCSSLPSREVFLGNPQDPAEAEWILQNRSSAGDRATVPFKALDSVWFKSLKTDGYLSVRSNEGWTASGKLWTRDAEGVPTMPFSWEKFAIHPVSQSTSDLTPAALQAEVERLNSQLSAARAQIAELSKANAEYKQLFYLMNKISK